MIIKIINRILFLAGYLLISYPSAAQQVIINSNGERIVMYPDGSWRMADEGDSLLIRQRLLKTQTLDLNQANIEGDPGRNQAENEDYVLRQWSELHFKIKEEEKKILKQFRIATNRQFKAGEKLKNAEINKILIEPDQLAQLNDEYDQTVKDLRKAKLNQKTIKKLSEESRKVGSLAPSKIEHKLSRLRSQFNLFLSSTGSSNEIPEMQNPDNLDKPDKGKNITRPDAIQVNLPPQNMARPYKSQPFDCLVIIDTVDEATGRRKIDLEAALLFTHTDPDLRPYFKDKELITCYGKLSKIEAYVYLTIDFQIASSHSQSNFGSLQEGSLLRLRLLNGEYVSLHNLKADRGRIDPYSGHTIFTGQYVLGKDEIKNLQSSELDKVRILWTMGYEDYDVYKVDFFIDQLNCLMSR